MASRTLPRSLRATFAVAGLVMAAIVAITAFVLMSQIALALSTLAALAAAAAAVFLYSAEVRHVRLLWASDRVEWTIAERDRQIGHARLDVLHTQRLVSRYEASEAELALLREQQRDVDATELASHILESLAYGQEPVTISTDTASHESMAEGVAIDDFERVVKVEQPAIVGDDKVATEAGSSVDEISIQVGLIIETVELVELDEIDGLDNFDLDDSFGSDRSDSDDQDDSTDVGQFEIAQPQSFSTDLDDSMVSERRSA